MKQTFSGLKRKEGRGGEGDERSRKGVGKEESKQKERKNENRITKAKKFSPFPTARFHLWENSD